MLTRRLLLTALAAACATTSPALAQSGKNNFTTYIVPPKFNAADQARIKQATNYLQGLRTAQGRFEQSDFRGRKTQGAWYLARPGKIRFEYDAPSSLLIVSDGKQVKMWDPRLKSFDAYPLDETPLSLFLSKQIRFDQGVVVTAVSSSPAGFTLKARDRRKQVEGSITLNFAQAANGALTLKDWVIVDAQGRATTVRLVTLTPDSPIKPELFVLNKPQLKK